MRFKTEVDKHHYYTTIEDFNELLCQYGIKQVLEDLRILDLTTYEDLVNIVMQVDGNRKKLAVLLKDPYFRHAGED